MSACLHTDTVNAWASTIYPALSGVKACWWPIYPRRDMAPCSITLLLDTGLCEECWTSHRHHHAWCWCRSHIIGEWADYTQNWWLSCTCIYMGRHCTCTDMLPTPLSPHHIVCFISGPSQTCGALSQCLRSQCPPAPSTTELTSHFHPPQPAPVPGQAQSSSRLWREINITRTRPGHADLSTGLREISQCQEKAPPCWKLLIGWL